ncbi:unnamed protein product, partial [Heligmosomoides polygyrus]|uniref:TauD domain-containing protein n=1 Tax=Heligmosomoides polygyrus TaxID=6339 RepID=A0A183GEB1_HELPZ
KALCCDKQNQTIIEGDSPATNTERFFSNLNRVELFRYQNGLRKVHQPAWFRSDFNMKTVAESFVKYGLVMVDGVEASAEATERLCRRVAPIHDTFFGAFWVFSNKAQEKGYHEDTAYGSNTIGPHTDGTYFNQTPGIQVRFFIVIINYVFISFSYSIKTDKGRRHQSILGCSTHSASTRSRVGDLNAYLVTQLLAVASR